MIILRTIKRRFRFQIISQNSNPCNKFYKGFYPAAALNFRMPAMVSMSQMNNAATFTSTSVPGVYKGKVNIEMAGEWQAQISFEGSAGSGKTVIPVSAQ